MIFQFSPIPEGFFGDSGLTATSANHIANLLKLRYERIENELNSLNFVTERMQVVGMDKDVVMKKALLFDADEIKSRLEEVAMCKGFIAFLREAIKEKKRLTEEIEDYTTLEYQTLMANQPKPQHPVSEEEIVNAMSIGDRVRYLATEARAATFGKFIHPGGTLATARKAAFEAFQEPTEARAATFGKFIHPGGTLATARKAAFEAFQEPTEVAMAGRDTVFVHRESAVSPNEIDSLISDLQAEQRKSEAELNGLNHEIDQTRVRDAQDKMDKFRSEKDSWDKETSRLKSVIDQARVDRRKVIEELKIVIPNKYRDLYETING